MYRPIAETWFIGISISRKQDAHGPHRSPVKPVNINKHIFSKLWLYHNLELERRFWKTIIFKFLQLNGPFLQNLESLSPKNALCQVWLKLTQWFCRRRFLYFVNVFSIFRYYLPLEKGHVPSFEQTWIPITQECFVPSLVEIGPMVFKKKIFKLLQCIFAISLLSPLRKERGPSFAQT